MKLIIRKVFFMIVIIMGMDMISQSQPGRYFRIKITDSQTGRGVPLVELKTTNHLSYYTDNNGVVAFYEPGLMNQDVYFHIKSHGYEYPADGFGYRGKSIRTIPGDSTTILINRVNIAERLYRVTGEGLYNDSELTGLQVPVKQPLLNGKVFGQDTFIETLYKGKIYWFWGDTDQPSYPLGNFATSGATSELPGKGGLDPAKGVDLNYFVDQSGFSKKMCPVPGPGPVWIHWLATLKDSSGSQRLIGSYTRIKTLGEAYERGLAVFDDAEEIFKPFVQFELSSPFFPEGHSYRTTVKGDEYINFDFGTPFPLRVRADWDHIKDPANYQAFTCLIAGSRYDTTAIEIDRDKAGNLIYNWKTHTHPLNAEKEKFLLKTGKLKPGETWYNLRDIITGETVLSKTGSVHWNEYRNKWVMVFQQVSGTSFLGEVWYAEGDTPTGPWVYARKIVTHDNYTFYNVGQHPLFDQDNGRLIYFEGTYTNSFTNNPVPTPRYNYNQVMYRLDLHDTRLNLPSPVYRTEDQKSASRYLMRDMFVSMNNAGNICEIPFFAMPPDRSAEGMVPVYEVRKNGITKLQSTTTDTGIQPLFFGLSDSAFTKTTLNGTWECDADGYSLMLDLRINGLVAEGTFNEESLIIKKGSIQHDTLELYVEDTNDRTSYILKARLKDGHINGEFQNQDDGSKGVFTGKQTFAAKIPDSFPHIVPLYEYKNQKGYFIYSVKTELEGFTRSEKPLCMVWENPSTLLTLDFEAKPVPIMQQANIK